jgi:hypothetical protein
LNVDTLASIVDEKDLAFVQTQCNNYRGLAELLVTDLKEGLSTLEAQSAARKAQYPLKLMYSQFFLNFYHFWSKCYSL